ncbi:DUF5107 domain-containing protein, partial [Escherichia coli]|uniref:DUF5107 domain-containing protein n=1 Tax=Escherichia coli TaxID=562 RepID=UPI003D2EDAFF
LEFYHRIAGGVLHHAQRMVRQEILLKTLLFISIKPGKKQWSWGHSEFGQAWDKSLTDNNGPYIELMTGIFADN